MLILGVALILFLVLYQKRMNSKQNELQLEKLNHRQKLMEAEIEVTEKEREKIAKNLHDDLGIKLNILNHNLAIISNHPDDWNEVDEILDNSINLLEGVIDSSRNIIYDSMPPALLKFGYIKATIELCSLIEISGRMKTVVKCKDINSRFPQKTELQLYRITQEIINNILKYANAKNLTIHISVETDLILTFLHDGIGISNEEIELLIQTGKGIGLRSIQSRVQNLNATIMYNENKLSPTIVIRVPEAFLT